MEDKINQFIENQQKALADFKAQLLKELNPPSSEFEVGRWYMYPKYKGMLCYTGKEFGFGFWNDGVIEWRDKLLFLGVYKPIRPATESEVKEALEKEAVKKDYSKCNRVISARGVDTDLNNDHRFLYNKYLDELWYRGVCVYKEGQWATIVKDEPIKIGGYEMKVKGETAYFGCKSISKAELMLMITFCERNSFQWIQFDKEETVRLDRLKSILEKLK